jgi:hypothetical protein
MRTRLKLLQSALKLLNIWHYAFIALLIGSVLLASFTISLYKHRQVDLTAAAASSRVSPQASDTLKVQSGAMQATNPTPTATPTTPVATASNDQACANAIRKYTSDAYSGSYPTTQAEADSYNQRRADVYSTWLAARKKLGCTTTLSEPYPYHYYGSGSSYSAPPAPAAAPPKVCDEAQKSNITTVFEQNISAENTRYQQQVNSFIGAHGITGSAVQQVSQAFMPQHQQNYTNLRTKYFADLAAINCNT